MDQKNDDNELHICNAPECRITELEDAIRILQSRVDRCDRHLHAITECFRLLEPDKPKNLKSDPLPIVPSRHYRDRIQIYDEIKPFLTQPRDDVFEWVDEYLSESTFEDWTGMMDNTFEEIGSLYPILLEFSKNPSSETLRILSKHMIHIKTYVRENMNSGDYELFWDNIATNPSDNTATFLQRYRGEDP